MAGDLYLLQYRPAQNLWLVRASSLFYFATRIAYDRASVPDANDMSDRGAAHTLLSSFSILGQQVLLISKTMQKI